MSKNHIKQLINDQKGECVIYKINIQTHFEEIFPYVDTHQKKDEILVLFQNLVFKLEKNLYHFENIKINLEKSNKTNNIVDKMPIYFEMESLFVSLRSTVDMLLHLLNDCLRLNIEKKDVSIFSIFQSNIPKNFKNIFGQYVTKRNNPIWEFIYTFRNDIVHDVSIVQALPITFKEIEGNYYIFCTYEGRSRDLLDLYKESLKLLDRFIAKTLDMLSITLKKA